MTQPDTAMPDVTPAAAPATDPAMLLVPDYTALEQKHGREINRIMMLTPEEQKQEFARYGVDPHALENHYRDLEVRATDLRHEGSLANRKTVALAIAAFSAAAGATFYKRKAIHESSLVQTVVSALAAFSAGFAATLAGGRLFGGDLKERGKALAVESHDIFVRELALAIENKQRAGMAGAQPPAEGVAAPEKAGDMAAKTPRRDPSFIAQAAAEKQASQQAGASVGA